MPDNRRNYIQCILLFDTFDSVLRTLLGVVFVSVLTNILVLSNITYGYQQVALGILIVVAVTVDALSRKVGKK